MAPDRASRRSPRVWLVLAEKGGDNAQALVVARALEERLGWRVERRNLRMKAEWVLGKPRIEPSLHHLDPLRSDPLEPPWPDIAITIGRRCAMAALWIRERSGGRTRIVLIGKPEGSPGWYDLVVASAEAQVPALPNLVRIALPLLRVDERAVREAAEAWRGRLAALPRPLVGVLVGGPTGPYVYDHRVVTRLLDLAREIARRGGTPYLTTSRRTPVAVADGLAAGLPPAARLFRWHPDAEDNPYRGLLALADGFVVTGDSLSMMVEVVRLGRPLQILELPTSRLGALDLVRRRMAHRLVGEGEGGATRLGRALYRAGLLGQTRDFAAFWDYLRRQGLAEPLGGPFAPPKGRVPDDLGIVVERVAALAPEGS